MKNVIITAIITAVLVFGVAVGAVAVAVHQTNKAFDDLSAVWQQHYITASDEASADWLEQHNMVINLKKNAKLFTDDWNAQIKRLSNEKAVLKSAVKEQTVAIECLDSQVSGLLDNKEAWEVALGLPETCLKYLPDGFADTWANNNLKSDEPETNKPKPLAFTDLVQESIKGVVHLQAPQWQGSGFVVGPRLIITARHCVEGVIDFEITTNTEHKIKATRAISDKEHDVASIWVDDLECVNDDINHVVKFGGEHDVVLTPLRLGSIKDCVLGQSIYVIGSPYGKVNFNSLTTGIISGVDVDWSSLGDNYGWEVAFTVDSAGHPGNSGCPVFTADGIVRGILVGGFSPVLISIMPCDLFLHDLDSIRLMFTQDRYRFEEAVDMGDWYNYKDNTEYYNVR